MSNRIRKLEIHDRILSPAEAELWLFLDADQVDQQTEVRGRLVGPTCPYADTVEVAYPLRRFPKPPEGLPPLARRIVIPEPSFWDPVTPFLYHGPIELWQDGQMCERVEVTHGLRTTSLSPRGLFWNGSHVTFKMVERSDGDEETLRDLHNRGINGLILPGFANELWNAADVLGFAVIGRTFEPNEAFLQRVASPSCLGWIIPSTATTAWQEWQAWAAEVHRKRRFLGVEIEQTPLQPLRDDLDFVVVPGLRDVQVDRPRLLRVPAGSFANGELGQLVISANA